MMQRRRFLSMLISILGNRHSLSGAAAIFASFWTLQPGRAGRPSDPKVDGLLGEVVESGCTGRLCVFGQGLTDVKDIIFDTPDVEVRMASVTGSEIIADIVVSDSLQPGPRMFLLKMKSGSLRNGGRIVVTAFAKPIYCSGETSCFPTSPGVWPRSPGWTGQPGSPEQYYEARMISSGLGDSLL